MEKMKKAISAFMALVLVLGMLPGVPMSAGAAELETQPDTVAVETEAVTETTEAAEVPEETEAVTVPAETEEETVPAETEEETVPAETEEETVPAETEEETVPEETTEETVPGETVAETVPEETIEDLQENLDAPGEVLDGVVVEHKVTDIQVTADKSVTNDPHKAVTYVGDKVTLSAKVSPANADIKDVEFYVVAEESDDIPYDQELLLEKGVLIAEEAGTLVLAARATDVETPHDSATQETGGKVEVTFVDYTMEINRDENAIGKDNWYDTGSEKVLRVMTGKKLELAAHYKINGKVELPLNHTKPNVKWYVSEDDAQYVTVTVDKNDCRKVTVTGKSVTDTKYIILHAKEETLGIVDQIQIAVYPIPYKVAVYRVFADGSKEEYTNDKMIVPLRASKLEEMQEAGEQYMKIDMNAQVWPLEAEEPVVWTSSDDMVQVVHPNKEDVVTPEGQEPEKDTTKATLRVYPLEGSTTITINSKNYPDVKSKIVIVRKRVLEREDLAFHAETEKLSNVDGLVSGQSFQLKVYDNRDPHNPQLLGSDVVRWYLSDEDQTHATVTEDGKLTAKKDLGEGKVVTVYCAVLYNEEEATLELPVIIRPKAEEVKILPGELAEEGLMSEDEILNGKTIAVDTAEGRKPFELGILVLPDEETGASQKVTWKSSDTKIAEIDPDTDDIIWKKNGTVTITATAADGSGKKASVKVKFCTMVRGIEIVQDDGFFLRSGKSQTFEVRFTPANPTNTGLTWSLVGENDSKYASVSSSGKLTAKTVYANHYVTLRATAKDGSGVYGETEVLIKPKKDGILTLKGYSPYVTTDGNYVTKTTQIIPVGDSIDLEAYILGSTELEDVKWKSSNKKAVLSDEVGGSTTVTLTGSGTFTITATSLEDSSNKATVTIKGVRMTDYIRWTHTHDKTELACGKSLTLKAKAYDAEGKSPSITKLAWSIEGEGAKYAKVSSSGKVTAIAGALAYNDEPVDITVVVRATDGSGAYETWPITIHPIVKTVTIDMPEGVYANTPKKGTNTYVLTAPGEQTIQMNAKTWPENAIDTVTWKSSSKSIAQIDANTGELTPKKAGTVTITATAADGSGKKATFKLTVLVVPASADFELARNAIAGGKSLKMKPVLKDASGKKITGKKLEWKVIPVAGYEDGTAYVSSISGGTLKTKKVTEPKIVEVIARTQEKNEAWEVEHREYITIWPAAKTVMILDENGYDIGKTLWVNLTEGRVQLDAATSNKAGESTYQGVNWKSSNTKVAKVDANGLVTFLKAGTVTITATAADGTGVKDTVKITIAK